MNMAIYDAIVAAWDSKYAYNRPRPSEFDKRPPDAIPNPQPVLSSRARGGRRRGLRRPGVSLPG